MATTDATQATQTALMGRVPWKLPLATAAEGIYIDLQDGRRIVDGVGGASVTAIGHGNPVVNQAIKDQVDKVACNLKSPPSET
jgi:E3 ubiquitin-protein ligase TRIP12